MNVLCITLNPAIDATYVVSRFEPGAAARTIRKHERAGGKGNNVARILSGLGHSVIATGFLGGFTGERIARGLELAGVTPAFSDLRRGESRTCHAILELETGRVSEILESGPDILPENAEKLLRLLQILVAQVDAVVLCGSAPPGLDAAWLDKLGSLLRRHPRFMVDSSGIVLKSMLRFGPDVIKPNQQEMRALIGIDTSLPESISFAQEHFCDGNRIVLHSLAADGACLISADDAWLLAPPEHVLPVNTVGCGDALLAGFLHSWLGGASLPDALRSGTACAAAAAQEETAGDVDSDLMHNILDSLPAPECLSHAAAGSSQP